jgi:hypothetical protein
MIAVPADTPVTTPVEAFTVAVAENPGLLHIPPGTPSLKVVIAFTHTFAGVMEVGIGKTVTVVIAGQPAAGE